MRRSPVSLRAGRADAAVGRQRGVHEGVAMKIIHRIGAVATTLTVLVTVAGAGVKFL